MAAPEDSKFGICYIWVISFLLFIFTISGAIVLVLYMIQPTSTTTSWYPIIGVSLVCFPWFFWLLTLLYRIVSRACGFRMACFDSFDADHPGDDVPSGGPANNFHAGGASTIQTVGINTRNGIADGGNDGNGDLENVNGNSNKAPELRVQPGSPRRVHFGGVVVLGEDDGGARGNRVSPKSLSPSPSPSPSSSPLRDSNESEMPLKLFMAS